jgi:hypothetical protein
VAPVPACRSTSATPTRPDSAARTRTQTGSCASTSPKAPTSAGTAQTTWPPLPPRSTAAPANPSAGRRQQRSSTNSYAQPNKAVLQRPLEPGQYTSARFAQFCQATASAPAWAGPGCAGITPPPSRSSQPLKNEMYHRQAFPGRARARFAVADCIEVSCNRQRLHSSLGYRTPAEVLTEFQAAAPAA